VVSQYRGGGDEILSRMPDVCLNDEEPSDLIKIGFVGAPARKEGWTGRTLLHQVRLQLYIRTSSQLVQSFRSAGAWREGRTWRVYW
jgi:hypothetical protein